MGLKLNLKQIERKLLGIYKSDMRYYTLSLVVSVPLILFFYDIFNLNANIYSTENLVLGLNPYGNQSLLVIGYTALPYNYFQTLLYNSDGFNAYIVVIASKLIAFLFTVGSAILIDKILLLIGVGPKKAKTAMLAFLFSPFIIFVNYIWVQPEFYSIFFLLLGIYAIERYNILNGKFIELLVGSFSLIVAGMTFYFPLILIPGYFIYIRGRTSKIKFFLTLMFSGIVLLLPIFLFSLKSTFAATLAGHNVDIFPYSLISLFLKTIYPIGEIEIIIEYIFVFSALVVPFLLYRYKKSMFLSQFIILALIFSLQVTGLNADTFIYLIPFVLIEYSLLDRNRFSFLQLIVLQMFLLPEYINVQLLNGPGYVSGLYYWIYFWYHQNIIILANIPYRLLVTQILNASTFIGIYLIIAYFLIAERYNMNYFVVEYYHNAQKTKTHETIHKKAKRSRVTYLSIAIVLILLISSLPFSLSHNTSSIGARDKLPIMFYVSNDPQNGQYIMQNKDSYCYFHNNNSLSFYNGKTTTYLYKNITNESYTMIGNVSFNEPRNLVQPQEIFQVGKFFAGITKLVNVNQTTNNLRITQQNYVNTYNIPGTENLGCYFLAQRGIQIFQLNETSYLRTSLNYSTFIGKTILFLIGSVNFTYSNLPIFSFKSGTTCNILYLNKSSFYFGTANTPLSSTSLSNFPVSYVQTIKSAEGNISASWNLAEISFLSDSSGVFILNGIKIPIDLSNNSMSLSIGEPLSKNNRSPTTTSSFFYTTMPYVFNVNSSSFLPAVFYRYNNIIKLLVVNNSAKVPFSINVTALTSNVSIGPLDMKTFKHFQYIMFGQIAYSIFPFSMHISLLEIQSEYEALNYTPIILINALLIPLSVILVWAYDVYRHKRS